MTNEKQYMRSHTQSLYFIQHTADWTQSKSLMVTLFPITYKGLLEIQHKVSILGWSKESRDLNAENLSDEKNKMFNMKRILQREL